MTAIIPFSPSDNNIFQFQATLDNQIYTVAVTWSLYGRRWMINILTLQQELVVAQPLIGSPLTANVSLTAGYFATVMVYREASNQFEVDPVGTTG